MTIEQMLKLIDAGFTKDEILKMATPAAPKEPKKLEAPAAPTEPEKLEAPASGPADDPAAIESEVDYLRKMVQELQKLNLAYASGVAPAAHTESIDDIMTTLLNGKAPAEK